jgi:nucleoside 2-deoxyribosyltransferase
MNAVEIIDTAPKAFVFVLMPFDQDFGDIYELGIKTACKEAGAYCERVDEQIFTDSILQRVYNQIAKADIVIADMTGKNPNVFYEVGYAHALGKTVILRKRPAECVLR